MPLQDMSRLNAIVPNACTPEVQERNNQAIRNALGVIINNITEIVNNNGLEIPVIGSGDTGTTVIPMQAKWAVSAGDDPANDPITFIEPTADNNWRGQIKAFPCVNSAGENIDTIPIWVVLPERLNVGVHLPKGAVFAYEETPSGELVAVSDYSAGDVAQIFWGIAQSDSVDGAIDNVTVRKCDNALGDNPVAPDITVLLPERDGYTHQVTTGDVIAFVEAVDGTYVCVSDYTSADSIPEIYRFELTDTLVPGGSADAEGVFWNGAAYVKTGVALTVYDFQDPGRWRGVSGYQGIAVFHQDRQVLEIIWMETIAEFAIVTPTENMSETNAGEMECDVVEFWNGNDPGNTMTVYDIAGMYSYWPFGLRMMVRYDWTEGKYRPIGTPTKVMYAKAQHNFENNGGDYRIAVKHLDGSGGTEVGAEFYVYFRGGQHNAYPNVIKDQEIPYAIDMDGVPVTTTGWDMPVGTVVFRANTFSAESWHGWQVQNGTANSTDKGGTQHDWTTDDGDTITHDEAPPIYLVPGTASNALLPSGGDIPLAHSHLALASPSQTGVKVYDPDNSGDLFSDYPAHRKHVHRVGTHCGVKDFATDTDLSGYLVVGLADQHGTDFGAWYSGTELEAEETHSDDHADIALRHDVYDPGHGHNVTVFPTFQKVHFKQLLAIERIDNSQEVTGI